MDLDSLLKSEYDKIDEEAKTKKSAVEFIKN